MIRFLTPDLPPCRRERAALTAALADKTGTIADLQEALDEAGEALADSLAKLVDTEADREHWALRATAAEATAARLATEVRALRARPSAFAALYALVALGWQDFWSVFETDASREGSIG